MPTREELEVGFNMMVASVLSKGQKKVIEHLKKKGVTDETIAKAKEAADSLIDDLFKDVEES